MREFIVDGSTMLYLSAAEWQLVQAGTLRKVQGFPVIDADMLRRIHMGYALRRGVLETDKVLSFLTAAPYDKPHHIRRHWRPLMVFWPHGHPDLAELSIPTAPDNRPLRVYFHRFHCFGCGLELDGFAVENDAYVWEELHARRDMISALAKRCPRCNGDLRYPGLVDIYHVYL